MAEVGVGQPGERFARGRDEDAAGLAAREHVGPVEDHRGGTAPERVGDEASPVLLEAERRLVEKDGKVFELAVTALSETKEPQQRNIDTLLASL